MRDDAFARIANGANLTYTIAQVVDNPAGQPIARKIYGWFNAPLYLNQPEPGVNVRLVLDPTTGLPVYQGLTPVNFTVLIPASLAANATTGKVVQYGACLHWCSMLQSSAVPDKRHARANTALTRHTCCTCRPRPLRRPVGGRDRIPRRRVRHVRLRARRRCVAQQPYARGWRLMIPPVFM